MNALSQTSMTQKQKDILAAAEEEFQKHGLSSAVVDTIVAKAGVSKRTLYKYFPSKLDLFQSVLMRKYLAARPHPSITYQKDEDFKDQLIFMIKNELDAYQSPAYLNVARIVLRELMLSNDEAEKVFAQLPPTGTNLKTWLSDAVKDGYLVCPDINEAADTIDRLIKSYAFYPQVFGFEALKDEQQDNTASNIVNIIMKTYDYPS